MATVVFNANGGTGTMANETKSVATALTLNAFIAPTGDYFTGWNTLANGTGTAYANGASYPFSASATLYAQWVSTTTTISGSGFVNGGYQSFVLLYNILTGIVLDLAVSNPSSVAKTLVVSGVSVTIPANCANLSIALTGLLATVNLTINGPIVLAGP